MQCASLVKFNRNNSNDTIAIGCLEFGIVFVWIKLKAIKLYNVCVCALRNTNSMWKENYQWIYVKKVTFFGKCSLSVANRICVVENTVLLFKAFLYYLKLNGYHSSVLIHLTCSCDILFFVNDWQNGIGSKGEFLYPWLWSWIFVFFFLFCTKRVEKIEKVLDFLLFGIIDITSDTKLIFRVRVDFQPIFCATFTSGDSY